MKKYSLFLFCLCCSFNVLIASATLVPVPADYDGDGKTDLAVWDASNGWWSILKSSDSKYISIRWGSAAAPVYDIAVPGDYDGDGKADIAVWRKSDGHWYIQKSSDGQALNITWGNANSTDIPVAADYDGDGKTDVAIWHPTNGHWYVKQSMNGAVIDTTWGTGGSPQFDTPVVGDFDGDGKADLTIWRKSDNTWYSLKSSLGYDSQAIGGFSSTLWGIPGTDIAAVADYDGDGKDDVAVWKPSDGNWYIVKSSGGQQTTLWGSGVAPNNDISAVGDFDGDGKADEAVLRPCDAKWYVLQSSNGSTLSAAWRASGAKASFHEFTELRSGAIASGNGWEVSDFAFQFVNVAATAIDVQVRLIADNPSFKFVDGQIGTWISNISLNPKIAGTLNISAPEVISNLYAIAPLTNFTGKAEVYGWVSGSNKSVPAQFYTYLLPQTPARQDADPDVAYFKGWDEWSGFVPGAWDNDLSAFVVSYTNYWHNLTSWPTGWHSGLTIHNNSAGSVTYTVKHVADGYSAMTNSPTDCNPVAYPGIVNQVGQDAFLTVPSGDAVRVDLETLFGWSTSVGSFMEGYLVITPQNLAAAGCTTVSGEVIPNTLGAALCPVNNTYLTSIKFTAPAASAIVSGTISIDTRTAVERGVLPTDIVFFVDGNQIGSVAASTFLGFDSDLSWNTTTVVNGPHTLVVKLMRGAQELNNATRIVDVQNGTTPTIISSTDASRCGPGSVTLSATASSGTLNWYAASGGGPSLGTGTTFVTPGINITTPYYVDATDNNLTSARTMVTATINQLPNVTLDLSDKDTLCSVQPSFTLSGGIPLGGSYQIDGVAATSFDPSNQLGLHSIKYTYTDGNNCSNIDSATILVNVCTSVEAFKDALSLRVYPNPSEGSFTVQTNSLIVTDVFIYNTLGELVQSLKLSKENNFRINLTNLNSGLYFIKSNNELQKVLVQ